MLSLIYYGLCCLGESGPYEGVCTIYIWPTDPSLPCPHSVGSGVLCSLPPTCKSLWAIVPACLANEHGYQQGVDRWGFLAGVQLLSWRNCNYDTNRSLPLNSLRTAAAPHQVQTSRGQCSRSQPGRLTSPLGYN